jgi:hypothetical protein
MGPCTEHFDLRPLHTCRLVAVLSLLQTPKNHSFDSLVGGKSLRPTLDTTAFKFFLRNDHSECTGFLSRHQMEEPDGKTKSKRYT